MTDPGEATWLSSSSSPGCWSRETWKRLGTVAYWSARHVLDEEEDAEDVVQKTMSALWARDTPPDDVNAWVRTVARCRAIDVVRNKVQERSLVQQLHLLVRADDALCPCPDDEVIAKMLIQTVLPGLPARQREALELRFLKDLDRKKIAECMHVSENTVKTLLHRGAQRLRQALAVGAWEEGER